MKTQHNVDIDQVNEAALIISAKIKTNIDYAIVLGTGLADAVYGFETIFEIPYQDIPHSPASTVESHQGKLILARKGTHNIIILSGRFHTYEGYTAKDSTFLIHVLNQLNVKHIFITNAVGGVNPHFEEGDIVLTEDHINFFFDNPLRGQNNSELGVRFPDMSKAYDKDTNDKLRTIGKNLQIELKNGVYFGWSGPSLETAAEYKMINILGADMVGMSSIPEVIVAKYYNMRVNMISIVSNVCYPASRLSETTIEAVLETMKLSSKKLGRILEAYFN